MESRRARRWLDRHGAADRPTTPLLRARLEARHRSETLSWVLAGVVMAVAVALAVVDELSPAPRSERAWLFQVGLFYVAIALGAVGGLVIQGRDERRIGAALTRRVAHAQAVRVGTVVGRWFLVTTAVTVGGGLLAGLLVAAGAADPRDRELGFTMLAAVGAFALIGLVGLVHVVRRPAVADDEQSLGDDLLLRREDALRAVAPYPAMLAAIAAVQSQSLAVLLGFLAYAVAAVVVAFLASWAVERAPAARPVSLSREAGA
jgi:hypothetical protein